MKKHLHVCRFTATVTDYLLLHNLDFCFRFMFAWSLTGCTALMCFRPVQTVSKKRCLDTNKKCDFGLKFDPNHIWRLFEKRLQSDFSPRCLESHFKSSPSKATTQLHPTLDRGSGGMSSFFRDPGVSMWNPGNQWASSAASPLKCPPEDSFCSRTIACPPVTVVSGLPAGNCEVCAAVSRSDRRRAAGL